MALERIFEEENKKIDNNAQIKKNVVSYFGNLINSNYQEFVNVFSPIIEKKFKDNLKYLSKDIEEKGFDAVKQEFFERQLYTETSSMIKKLSDDAGRIIGMTIYREKVESPDVQLGFSEYFKYEGLEATGKKLTKKGTDEINSYREMQDLRYI